MNACAPTPNPPRTGLLLAALAALIVLALGARWLDQSALGLALACGLFAVVVATGLVHLPVHHPHRRFGAANQITLGRASLACALAGTLPTAELPTWPLVAFAGVAAVLDAVDGWLARRSRLASPFGARFDMEIDALLILVLAILVWRLDRAGAWVLASGLMRYGFVIAALAWPWLAAPLPPSTRRKVVCVVQVVTLVVCLAPIVPDALARLIAAAGLIALTASFAVDIGWLYRQRSAPAGPAPAR